MTWEDIIHKKGKARRKAGTKRKKKKRKSTVNQSGNYTKPGLRRRIFNRIKKRRKGR